MEIILNGYVIFVTIHWTHENIYIGDNHNFLAALLGFHLVH